MRFISFPFHGLEQLVEYNRNSTAVKRFLPIYASRCTRYPHYESPPAKTQSFPQPCRCTGKRCFQQFIGGSKTRVPTSSGDVFSAVRAHRCMKKRVGNLAGIGWERREGASASPGRGDRAWSTLHHPRQNLPSAREEIAVENRVSNEMKFSESRLQAD